MIQPIRAQQNIYTPKFTAENRKYHQAQTKHLSYGHSLGTSALFGLSAMGFSTIFMRGWTMPFAVGTAFAGLMMLFNLPDKLYNHK